MQSITTGDKILSKEITSERARYSSSHLYKLSRQHDFPPIINLGAHASGFLESQVTLWQTLKLAASRSQNTIDLGAADPAVIKAHIRENNSLIENIQNRHDFVYSGWLKKAVRTLTGKIDDLNKLKYSSGKEEE